ncbi:MAG: ATP-binding protein [Polyangiaceae bacterium]
MMPSTILVVEDERVVAKELQRSLQSLGYAVPSTAATAEDAILCASRHCPDLVLMDIGIKGERDGIETAELLRDRFDVPVIYVTAYADRETLNRAKRTTPHGYLIKPVKEDDLLVAIEIALHKKAEERQIEERERWLSTTLRAVDDAVVVTNASGEVTFMNRAAESLLGLQLQDVMGRPAQEILEVVDETTRRRIADPITVAKHGKVVQLATSATLVSMKGEKAIEECVAPILDNAGRLLGAVVVFRDVSYARRMQQEMAMADRLSSLGMLAAGVGHEINNPLAVIIGNGTWLAGQLPALVPKPNEPLSAEEHKNIMDRLSSMGRALGDLLSSAERARGVIADLKAFARPEEEGRRRIDLRQVVRWAMNMSADAVESRARLNATLEAVPLIDGNEVRLGQVFVNLLVNAAQAVPPGAPEQNEVHISTSTDSLGRAVVVVRDTGSGIAAEHLARIFEPFFTTKTVGAGHGLGLSVCHGVIAAHDGDITVESTPGIGTTFRVLFPPAFTEPKSSPPTRH